MEITHDVTIDLLRPRQNVIRVVQEDSTRMIRLKLLSNNQNYNVADDLDEGETLLKFVEFRKSDGHGGMYDTTSTGETAVELEDQSVGNVWLVALDGQCFTCPGWTQINVRFETEDGKRIHTFRIMVDVEPTASSDTESTDWGELNSIGDLKAAVASMWDKMFPPEAKQKLLTLLSKVAYIDEHGQEYLDELEEAMFQTADIVSISAVFDQGSAVIYDIDDLDTLRQYLTVTATYEDLSTREITAYTLSGTLTEGTSTITVSYGGKTTTFNVAVTYKEIQYCEYIELNDETGADCWINTNIIPSNTFGFKLIVQRIPTVNLGTIAGIKETSGDSRCWVTAPVDSSGHVGLGWNTMRANSTGTMPADAPSELFANYKNDRSWRFNNETVETNLPTLYSFTRPFILMGKDNVGTINGTRQTLYGAEFTLGSDVTHRFVPAYKRRTGEIGLYEEIEGVFYSKSGTGNFVKGGDV